MARTTGPLLSQAASGGLAHTLTYSRVLGAQIAKRQPHRATRRSRPERAARARLAFLQRAWKPDIVGNNLTPDWQPAANQRTISPYNAFIGDGLEQTNGALGPRVSPLQLFGDNPGNLSGYTATVSANTVQIIGHVNFSASMWGGWFYLLQNPLEGCHPQSIATSFDVLQTGDIDPIAYPILNLPHNTTWYVGWRTFSYDGTLSTQSIPGSTVHIR